MDGAPLSIGIDNMVNDFLSKLTSHDSISPDSLLTAYITIAQDMLGLMDVHTRAVPDFMPTMSQAIRYVGKSFSCSKADPAYKPPPLYVAFLTCAKMIPWISSALFIAFSLRLRSLARILSAQTMWLLFLGHGSFKSARDQIK